MSGPEQRLARIKGCQQKGWDGAGGLPKRDSDTQWTSPRLPQKVTASVLFARLPDQTLAPS